MKFKVIVVSGLVLSAAAIIGAGSVIKRSAEGRTFSDVSLVPYRKVGVLLGCSRHLSGGQNNLFFLTRTAAAVQLFKAQRVDYLIVSGDNHVAGYDEATDMKNELVKAGVPAERIYCDYAGFRTLDSVVRAKEVFGQDQVTIISQEFHNQRAIYIAKHRGIDAVGFNARDVDAYNSFRTRIREQFARVKTVLDVWLLNTRPKFTGSRIRIGQIG
jgi:SanA protein